MAGIRSTSTDVNYVLIGNAHDGATGRMANVRPQISRPLTINEKQVLLVYKHTEYDSAKKAHIYHYERTIDDVTTVSSADEG